MVVESKTLFIIPARGGSKGLPGKNIMNFCGKQLISYSIDYALNFAKSNQIHVSTDDDGIASIAKLYGANVDFLRLDKLSADNSTTEEVIKFVILEYSKRGRLFETVIILQPTSPIRNKSHLINAYSIFNESKVDMLISVVKSKSNPYFNLYEENEHGFLNRLSNIDIARRQDAPEVYQANGNIYIINIEALFKVGMKMFDKIVKYVMPEEYFVDIDTELDFFIAENIFRKLNP